MNTPTQEHAVVRQVSLAVGASATHEARSGQSYEMFKDKPAFMPLEDAYSFLVDKAFEVRSAKRVKNDKHDPNDPDSTAYIIIEGAIITPVSNKKVDGGRVELDEDEVIARLDELTHDALLKRCKRQDGSEGMKQSNKKEELVKFLIQNKPKAVFGLGRGSENAPLEMDGKTLDNILDMSSQLSS